jgi:hypothetical protein
MILAKHNEHCDVNGLVSQCIRNIWGRGGWRKRLNKGVLGENSSNGNKEESRTKTKSFPLT